MAQFCKMEDRSEEESKIRVPRQARGIKTRNQILKAAKKMFSEQGFHGTNSKQIATEAGVSIGSFYSYFPNKKKLFVEVLGAYETQRIMKIVASQLSPLDGVDLTRRRGIVRNLIQSILDAHAISPRFHREVMAMRYADPEIGAHYDAAECKAVEQLADHMRQLEHKPRVKDIDAAALVIYSSVEEVVKRIKLFRCDQSEERVVDALTDMIYRFLFDVQASDDMPAAP